MSFSTLRLHARPAYQYQLPVTSYQLPVTSYQLPVTSASASDSPSASASTRLYQQRRRQVVLFIWTDAESNHENYLSCALEIRRWNFRGYGVYIALHSGCQYSSSPRYLIHQLPFRYLYASLSKPCFKSRL